jgi:hypothetical protein
MLLTTYGKDTFFEFVSDRLVLITNSMNYLYGHITEAQCGHYCNRGINVHAVSRHMLLPML